MRNIVISLILIALFAFSVSAVQMSIPTVGGPSQARDAVIPVTVSVTNDNQNDNLTNIAFTLLDGAADAKFGPITFVNEPDNLSVGETATFTMNVKIPLSHNAVDPITLLPGAFKVGSLKIQGDLSNNGVPTGASATVTVDINMEAANLFDVNKVRVECETKSKNNMKDGDELENLKPGETCSLEIEGENDFSDNSNTNTRGKTADVSMDVEFSTFSSDGDVDVDLDDSSLNNLRANNEDEINGDIEIDEEADDRTYNILILAKATDENGAIHGEKLEFGMEVDRSTHDILVRRLTVSPTTVDACRDTNVKVNAGILNQGKRNEDEVAVEMSVPSLSITDRKENMELDENDGTSLAFNFVVPKGTEDGVLRVDIETFFDEIAPSNTASAEVTVNGCATEEEEEAEEEQTPVVQPPVIQPPVVQPPVTQPAQGTAAQPATRRDSGFTSSPAYIALLAVISVVVLVVIVLLIVLLVRRPAAPRQI